MEDAKRKIDLVSGVSEALKFKKNNPRVSDERVMEHIMKFIKDRRFKETKLDIIVGVAYTLNIIERNPKIKDKEVVQLIVKNINNILPKDS